MPALFANDPPGGGPGWLRRLDVRTKMGVSLLASLVVIVFNDAAALGLLTAASGLYALAARRAKLLLLVYAVVVCMWCAAVGMMGLMVLVWPDAPTIQGRQMLVPFLRTVIMANVALALAFSSSIQALLATLKTLRLPLCIYIPLAVMVRFLPTFIEDARQIGECLRIRGHRSGLGAVLVHPVLTLRLLLMPLLFRSLRASDELGTAAELKGLGYGSRITPLRPSRLGRADGLMALLALVALAAGSAMQFLAGGISGGFHP